MVMDYRLYQEIAQLGRKQDKHTFLMREPDGRVQGGGFPAYSRLPEAAVGQYSRRGGNLWVLHLS